MQHAEGEGTLEGQAGANGASAHHPVQTQAHPQTLAPPGIPVQAQPQPAPQAAVGTWGQNTRLGPRDVKRAILKDVQDLGKESGRSVPSDLSRFLDSADVLFLDENNQPVRFSRVVVTWEG